MPFLLLRVEILHSFAAASSIADAAEAATQPTAASDTSLACLAAPSHYPQADVYVAALDVPGAKRLIPQARLLLPLRLAAAAVAAAMFGRCGLLLLLWLPLPHCNGAGAKRARSPPCPPLPASTASCSCHPAVLLLLSCAARFAACLHTLTTEAGDCGKHTEHLRVGKLQLLSTPKTS